jgi:nickel transport protein
MARSTLLALMGASALLLAPAPAGAHGIQTDLERFAGLSAGLDFSSSANGSGAITSRIRLRSEFSTGEPAVAATVRLLPSDGTEPIELGSTDASGSFDFDLPPQAREDWEIQVDAGPGHRDYLELQTDAPAPNGETAPAAAPAGLLQRLNLLGGSAARPAPALLALGLLGGVGVGRWLGQRRRQG